MTLKLTFLVVVLLYKETKCSCRQSYMTFCDDLDDLKDYDVENWTDLVVGDENADDSRLRSVNFDSFSLDRFDKLINLIVVRQINDIKTYTFGLDPQETKVEYLKLYGNNIKRIRFSTFDAMILRKLSLANNSIEYVHKGAFYNCEIKTIDLSNNKLEMIEQGVFTAEFLGNKTKEMIFSNNKLEYAQPLSLPSSLEILNFDHNNFKVFQGYTVLDNLINLQVLTLSYNKLTTLPPIKNLTEIIAINASHNSIQFVYGSDFNGLSQLQVLDLSYNKISDPAIFRKFNFPQRFPSLQISLVFNRLTHLLIDGNSFRNHIVLLYGNPWNCECWASLEKFMVENQVIRNECDLKYFGNGKIPYCIYYDTANCTEERKPYKKMKDVEDFLDMIKQTHGIVGCRLSPRIL